MVKKANRTAKLFVVSLLMVSLGMFLLPITASAFDFTVTPLIVEFEDNEKRILDMRPYLNFGRFKELKSQDKFRDVHIAFDTIQWGNGLDLDPEFIYIKSKTI